MKSLYDAFFTVVARLHDAGIPYCVIGGFAMAFHDVVRGTRDIDLLILATSLPATTEVMKDLGFQSSGSPFTVGSTHRLEMHRFVQFTEESHILVDLAIGQDSRTEKIVERSVSIDPGNGPVRVARVEDLIFLKGLRLSDQDRIDIDRLGGSHGQD